MTTTIEERVTLGAALLDEKSPGWESYVDLRTFNIRNCDSCVLGQVFGGYYTGAQELGLSGTTGQKAEMAHGFWGEVDPYSDDSVVTFEYQRLQQAWVQAIEERRAMRALEAEDRKKVDA